MCNLRMRMAAHLQIMPPMIGETLLLYLEPRSTCGQPDFADDTIGRPPCHSPQRASRGALIVYIRVYPVPKLATGEVGDVRRGQAGHGWESVQRVRCVWRWSAGRPRDPVLDSCLSSVWKQKTSVRGVCPCGAEVQESSFSCPFKGIAPGPKISLGLRPVSEAGGLTDPRRGTGLHHGRCISWQGGFIQWVSLKFSYLDS